MQRHPFVVHADARLSRAYRLFRAMGLRHMYITPSRPQIVGVVTRKDLAEECAALTLGERGAEESAMDEGSVGSQGRGDHKGDGVGAAYGLPFLPYYPDNVSRESHRYAGDENPSSGTPRTAEQEPVGERGGGQRLAASGVLTRTVHLSTKGVDDDSGRPPLTNVTVMYHDDAVYRMFAAPSPGVSPRLGRLTSPLRRTGYFSARRTSRT